MVILDVFTRNICITYKTTLLSKAALLTFLFGVISVVLPFIFAYKSKGFWLKREIFYEQPDVKFRGEYIFTATTNNYTNPVIICSTIQPFREKFDVLDTCSIIKVREIDTNFDGKVDELKLSLQVNLPFETQITSLCAIILVDYKLQTCPLQMQTGIILQQVLAESVSKYVITSDLKIFQASPLTCQRKQPDISYNYSVISYPDDEGINYDISSIVEEYSKRNLTINLRNLYSNFILSREESFTLQLNLRYSQDMFFYKPGFWHTMKWAWIQYISIYLIISWFVNKIKSYIFNRRLVLFYEDNPVKKKQ